MSETNRHSTTEVRQPEPPLPEDSGLTLEEYLAMQQAISHTTRFRILRTLVANDELSAADLKAAVDVESHNFHYHLTSWLMLDSSTNDSDEPLTATASIRTIGQQQWVAGFSNTALRNSCVVNANLMTPILRDR